MGAAAECMGTSTPPWTLLFSPLLSRLLGLSQLQLPGPFHTHWGFQPQEEWGLMGGRGPGQIGTQGRGVGYLAEVHGCVLGRGREDHHGQVLGQLLPALDGFREAWDRAGP